MTTQYEINKKHLLSMLKVQKAMFSSKYEESMLHSALTIMKDHSSLVQNMNDVEKQLLEEIIIEYFNERQWIGEHPSAFRFDKGSLFKFDEESDAYIHCFKRVGCNTEAKAIAGYFEELNQ